MDEPSQPPGPDPTVFARRRIAALGVLALAVVIVAIVVIDPFGGDEVGGSEAGVEETVERFVDAARSQDFETVCALFTDSLRRQYGGADCESLLGETSFVTDLTVAEVEIEDSSATVVATIGDSPAPPAADAVTQELGLQLVEGEWLLSRLG